MESFTLSFISKETLFAVSLFPYLGFFWFLQRSQKMPKMALMGFYAETYYKTLLANVGWLHGGAEFFFDTIEYFCLA
jgi:hypothetical protein